MAFGNFAAAGSLTFGTLVVFSIIKLLLGIVYFAFSLLIIKIAAGLVGYSTLSADWAVMAAAVISAASILGKER
jgi:hypothetical protein